MTRPNIVFVLADDLGWGDLGAFGNSEVYTPHLDALAQNGLLLTQHYSASAVCAPARAGLLTGRYPHRTGAIDTLEGRGLDRLATDEVTVADVLGANGYATGLIGKWHLGALDGSEGGNYHPNRRGFDEFAGFRGGWQDYWDWQLDRNGTVEKSDGQYLTDVFTDEAVAFIDRHANEPFFLHVCYNAPHTPLQVPDVDADRFRDGTRHEAVARLYGMVSRMDEGIGRIVETLKRHNLLDNTLFVFTSDNGPQFGSELGPGTLKRPNGNLRGQKTTVFEGGIRVPAIVHFPEQLQSGRKINQLIHFTDWFATLLDATAINLPSQSLPLDGQSVLPVLQGETGNANPVRFWQWNRYTPVAQCNAAMRDGNWKLVFPSFGPAMTVAPEDLAMDKQLKYEPDSITDIWREPEPARDLSGFKPEPLLFDLATDPTEQNDLVHLHPDRVRTMQTALAHWFESVEADRKRSRKE